MRRAFSARTLGGCFGSASERETERDTERQRERERERGSTCDEARMLGKDAWRLLQTERERERERQHLQ